MIAEIIVFLGVLGLGLITWHTLKSLELLPPSEEEKRKALELKEIYKNDPTVSIDKYGQVWKSLSGLSPNEVRAEVLKMKEEGLL